MPDVDLPGLDPHVVQLPLDLRRDLAEAAKNDLWYMANGVLGYSKLRKATHGGLCVFMVRNEKLVRMILMPRDHYKTTICTISDSIRILCKNPEERILLGNETLSNSSAFLGVIQQHFESNQIFRALFSDIIPPDFRKVKWNQEQMEVVRQGYYAQPSIDTVGMGGASTSRHYTYLKLDDLIAREAAQSRDVMQKAITWFDNVISLLDEPQQDRIDIIGTRWAYHDVYSHAQKVYGSDMARYFRSAIESGVPIFPELMTLAILDRIRQANAYLYSCQYANNPRNPDIQDFNVAAVRRWRPSKRGDSVVYFEGETATVIPIRSLDITTTVDPAVSEKIKSDRTAIVTTGVSPDGMVFVLEVIADRMTPSAMIDKLFEVNQKWHPRIIGVEAVAYQKALKYFVRDEMERRDEYLPFQELKIDNRKSKETRIRGLQPVIKTSRLFVQTCDQLLLDEIEDFPLGEHDDAVDALAMHLQLWRGTVSKDRMQRFKEEEKHLIRDLRQTVAGYGPSAAHEGHFAVHKDDFDEGDDDLEARSAYEFQHTQALEVA